MNENIEYMGYWYLPNHENNKIYGKLNIYNDEIKLEICGKFEGEDISDGLQDIDTINGFTVCGKAITLFDNYSIGMTMSMPGMITSRYKSGYMIIGQEYKNKKDCILSSISCNYTNLFEWVNISGLEYGYEEGKIVVKYEYPENYLYNLDDFTLEIYGNLSQKNNKSKVEMLQYVSIKFDNLKNCNFESALEIIFDFSRFLALCIGKSISPYDIKANNIDDKDVKIIIPIKNNFEKDIMNHDMLIPFKFINNEFKKCLINWNLKKEKLEPVIDYVIDFNSKVFHMPLSFIKLSQAMETFSRRMRTNCKIDEDKHKQKIEYILDKIDVDEYKDWLNEKLRYSNEPSLAYRIKQLLKEVDFIMNLNSAQRKKIVNKIVDTRNYYTHFDESKKDLSMSVSEMFWISKYMEVVLRVLIMKELGIDEKSIQLQLKDLNNMKYIQTSLKKEFNIKLLS